jgi:hypothetical protein
MAAAPPRLQRQYDQIRQALVALDRSAQQSDDNRRRFMQRLLSVIEDIYDDMVSRLRECETGRDVREAIGPLEEINPDLFELIMEKLAEQVYRNNNSYDFDAAELKQSIEPILLKDRRNLRFTAVDPQPLKTRITGPRTLPEGEPPPDDSSIFDSLLSVFSNGRGSRGSRGRPPPPFRPPRSGPRRDDPITRRRNDRGSIGSYGSIDDDDEPDSDDDLPSLTSTQYRTPLRPRIGGWLIKTKSKSQVKNKSLKTKNKRARSKKRSKERLNNKPKLSFM